MDPSWSGATSGVGSNSSGQHTVSSSVSGSTNPQEWCLHAQLTIRHPTAGRVTVKPATAVVTATENAGRNEGTREGNVRFECSWENSGESVVTQVIPIEQGIQKFESWLPPSSSSNSTRPSSINEKNEEGDCSRKPSSSSSRKIQPYSRRCKSTCSITLANHNTGTATVSFENQSCGGGGSGESGRASSLPPEKPPVKDAETQTMCREKSGSTIKRVPSTKIKIPGSSEGPSRVPSLRESKDEATYSIVDRIRKNIFEAEAPANRWKNKNVSPAGNNSTERPSRRTRRSSSSPSSKHRAKSTPSLRHEQQQQEKVNQPRTIHIDVYCTGSEVSTNTEDNCSSSTEDSTATPQTVFESAQYKVSHHMKKKQMPICFTSNVADLVNLATNQVKQSRKERGRPGSFGKMSNNKLIMNQQQRQDSKGGTDKSRETKGPLKAFDLSPCASSVTDSATSYYPSSDGISRDTTTSSFASSSWMSTAEYKHEHHGIVQTGWRNAREITYRAESQSIESGSIVNTPSYVYSDSLEDFDIGRSPRDQELPEDLRDSQVEQWWIDYIFKKFNIDKEDSVSNIRTPASAQWETPERESTNLVKMKRLSIPNANLLDGMSLEDLLSSGRDGTQMSEDEGGGDSLLNTASKFGRVKKGLKKPGHHIVGPAKNPDCPCEHCRFHFEKKDDVVNLNWKEEVEEPQRTRAHSFSHVDSFSSASTRKPQMHEGRSNNKQENVNSWRRKKAQDSRSSPSWEV